MIISRYLLKEIFVTLLGVSLVLLLIAISVQMVGLLSKVTAGILKTNTLMIMMGLNMFNLMTFILPLALYLGILLALSRLYRDSEMTAIAACGVGPLSIMRTVFIIGLLFALIQGSFTLYLAPWAETHYAHLTEKSKKSTDIEGVIPGRFNELTAGKGVVYVQTLDDERGELQNVFLQMNDDSRKGDSPVGATIVAERAYKYQDEKTGDQFLLLENGSRYEGFPGDENFTVIQFKRHGIRVEEKSITVTSYRHRAIPTRDLFKADHISYKAELQGRISSALFCIGLALLAVPLSKTSQRQGRYGKLALAIVFYMVFSNLLNVAKAWVINGKVSPEIGVWWVHGLILLVVAIMMMKQTGFRHLFGFKQRHPAS
ncbi:MAG: LPS export ABC transporter permease LptF [Gammaproteobacteria bacterium]|nr:LPS export ABC transporter permease LptF [Gammaproteobacteria bacterium]